MSDSMTAEQALAEAIHAHVGGYAWLRDPAEAMEYSRETARQVLDALPEGWSLTATPPDSDAQIAVLREALASADCDQDSPRVRRALADTEATAKAYRDEIVKPWREGVRAALRDVSDYDDLPFDPQPGPPTVAIDVFMDDGEEKMPTGFVLGQRFRKATFQGRSRPSSR